MISGTIRNSVNLTMQQNKWQQKVDSGNVLSKKERNERANWTQVQRMKHEFEQQAIQERESRMRNAIDGKIMAGQTLTPEEEAYLAKKDPQALTRYREGRMEKKAYEEKIRRCKTKDEVDRLKSNTINGYLASFKKIEHNSCIPISEKLAKAQELLAKTRMIEDVETKFKASAEYEELPTEAELLEEQVEETEAQYAENLEKIEDAVEDNEDVIEETLEAVKDDDASQDEIAFDNESEVLETTEDDAENISEDSDDSKTETEKEKTDKPRRRKKDAVQPDYHKEIADIFKRLELVGPTDIQPDKQVYSGPKSAKSQQANHISIIV